MKLAKPQYALVHAEHQRLLGGKAAADVDRGTQAVWLSERKNSVLVLSQPISGFLTFIIPKPFEPTLLVIWVIFMHTN